MTSAHAGAVPVSPPQGSTLSLCSVCKQSVPAEIRFVGEKVFLDKVCPEHGARRALVASSVDWYLDALSFVAPSTPPGGPIGEVRRGCPFDCGPCAAHEQKVYLPVVPITSSCNLDCPICYTVNKNDAPYEMSGDELAQILVRLKEQHEELDIINFTGGEPTMHPALPKLLGMARDAGIRRLTVSTNGLRLKDEAYVRELAATGARIILSLDTFDPDVDRILLGANTVRTKLDVLDLLERHDVTTTILPAVAAGLNDRDLGRLFDLMMAKPNVVSLELHTLTFTGQGGSRFDRAARITTPDLHRLLEAHTSGAITARDFVPSPLAHPHCYSICYLLLLDDGRHVPLTRFVGRERVFDLLRDSLYLEPRDRVGHALQNAMDDLWANPDVLPEAEAVLSTLKRLLGAMYPRRKPISLAERQRIAERAIKAIYIHAHMDEETFDVARVKRCSVGVPAADGSNIPTCSYNVLYRENDARFTSREMLDRMGRSEPSPLEIGPPKRRHLPLA